MMITYVCYILRSDPNIVNYVSWPCVRSVGPAPELVRHREAKWINIISQWDHILQKKNSKVCCWRKHHIYSSYRPLLKLEIKIL